MDTRWNHPFTCVVPGPAEFVARLLLRASSVIDSPPETMTRCYWECQPTYAMLMETVPNSLCKEGLPNASVVPSQFEKLGRHRRPDGGSGRLCHELIHQRVITVTRSSCTSCRTCFKTKKQKSRASRHSQDVARVKKAHLVSADAE